MNFNDQVAERLGSLAKPLGSLGRLEHLAADLARTQNTLAPCTRPRRLVLFAADHGVVREGVSAWPATVTREIARAITAGVAASSTLAKATQTELHLVDVGMLGPELLESPTVRVRKIAAGTRNLREEPAMTLAEFEAAFQVGVAEAQDAYAAGCRVLATGEMGIGNTTAAACLAALLAGTPVEVAVGPGAGSTEAILTCKREVVVQAVKRAQSLVEQNLKEAMASVCGFEIAAMAGFIFMASQLHATVVLDGYIATTAALIAELLHPGTAMQLMASHRSAEPGHLSLLNRLQLTPYLDGWQMRLGEGTGALVFMPLLDAARAILCEMATLQELGLKQA